MIPLMTSLDTPISEETTAICRLGGVGRFCSSRMNHGASTNVSSMAVIVAMIVRNGMYRRTLSQLSQL